MQSLEWVDAVSVEHAVQLLADKNLNGPVVAKAGGIDLIDLMKEGILVPARMVNLKSIPGLDQINVRQSGELEIGAMTSLARIANDPHLRKRYPAVSEAAAQAATPQIRNAATIGGNLLQKPRCWYYRNRYFHNNGLARGDPASSGQNQYHAIFNNSATSMVHASTPATALLGYSASVELVGGQGRKRSVPVREFFLPPDFETGRVTVIEPDEILTHLVLPPQLGCTKSAYHKQTDRDSYDWPICDVAVVLGMEGSAVRTAAIAMGWVASTPRRATESERILIGKGLSDGLIHEAARAAIAGATPLSKNGYKVPILETVVRRTIYAAAE
ncbi:MAG: FAD binding domain-containing protein [Candidatus Korobacteraceae bacterium]